MPLHSKLNFGTILLHLNVHFLVLGIFEAIIRESRHFFDCDDSDFSVLAIEDSCDLFQRWSLGLNVPVLLLARFSTPQSPALLTRNRQR